MPTQALKQPVANKIRSIFEAENKTEALRLLDLAIVSYEKTAPIKHQKMTQEMEQSVIHYLQKDWSPEQISGHLKNAKDATHSITSDNGKEFSDHEKISKALGVDFYFAHPYSSWERGTSEAYGQQNRRF